MQFLFLHNSKDKAMTSHSDRIIKRHVIGNRVELRMTERGRKIVIFKELYTYKSWGEWKKSHSGLLNEFFKI